MSANDRGLLVTSSTVLYSDLLSASCGIVLRLWLDPELLASKSAAEFLGHLGEIQSFLCIVGHRWRGLITLHFPAVSWIDTKKSGVLPCQSFYFLRLCSTYLACVKIGDRKA